jgi:hypothetical protein
MIPPAASRRSSVHGRPFHGLQWTRKVRSTKPSNRAIFVSAGRRCVGNGYVGGGLNYFARDPPNFVDFSLDAGYYDIAQSIVQAIF